MVVELGQMQGFEEEIGPFGVPPIMPNPQQTAQQMPQQTPQQTGGATVELGDFKDFDSGMPQAPGMGPGGVMKSQFKDIADLMAKDFIPDKAINFSVDQATGVDDFGFRSMIGLGDTSDEKLLIAKKYVGEDGVELFDGKMALNSTGLARLGLEDKRPDNMKGVPILIDELGLSMGDIADESDDMTQSVMLAGNFLATRGAGPLALLLRSLASGLGATGTKLGQERVEEKLGIQLQNKDQIMDDAVTDGLVNFGAELGFSGLDFVGRKALGPNTTVGKHKVLPMLFGRPKLETTIPKETMEMVDVAKRYNLNPSITQATEGKLISRPQQIAERVFNSQVDRVGRNVAGFKGAVEEEISQIGGKIELNEEQMLRYLSKDAEMAKKRAQRGVAEATEGVDASLTRSIDDVINERGLIGDPGMPVKDKLNVAMNNFRSASKELYARVDQLAGNKPIVSTKNLREKWAEVQDLLPKGKDGQPIQTESVRELTNLLNQIPNSRQTFAGAQEIRVQLGKLAYSPELKGTNGERIAGLLQEAITKDFDNIVLGMGPSANRALKKATKFYADNVGKFDNVLVASLTRDMRKNGSVPINRVVDTIIDSQNVDAIDNVRKLVGPEMWQQVKTEKLSRLAKSSVDVESGQMLATYFEQNLRALDPKGGDKVFKAFFGKDAKAIRRLTKELSAVNGSVDPRGTFRKLASEDAEAMAKEGLESSVQKLDSGAVKTALKDALQKIEERDALMQNKLIQSLDRGDELAPNMFDHLLSKDGALKMRDAVKFVGKDSERHKQMKKVAMRRLLEIAIKPSDDATKEIFGGTALFKKIKEIKPALHQLYGKEFTKKLEELGALSAFLSSEKRFAGGLIASAIAVRPLANLGRIVKLGILEKLMSKDTFLDWATKGVLRNPNLRTGSQATARMVGQQGLNIVMSELGDVPSQMGIGMDSMKVPTNASQVDLSELDEQAIRNMGTQEIQ